jgi:beta-glucosidase
MDIEMPFPMMRGAKLLQAIQQGDVQEDDLRPRVEKVLQYIRRANPPRQRPQERPSKYNAQRSALLRRTVGESVVLLKNQGGLLPLDVHQTKSIAVIGELATVSILPNLISPQYLVSPLDGIKGFVQLEAASCQINHAVGVQTHRIVPYLDERYTKQVEISIWKAKDRLEAGTGRQPYSTEVTGSAFKPMVGRHFPGLGGDFEIEMKAKIHVPKSGSYVLGLLTVGQAVVKLDEVTIMDHTPNRFVGIADMLFHQHEFQVEKVVQLEAGKQYNLHVVSQSQAGKSPELAQDLIVGMKEVVTNEAAIAEAVAAASKSDVAICFVGTGKDWEMEGFDRQTISLSLGQEEMVRQVAEANPNTIVVNQSGGAVDLMFAHECAKAVLHAHIGGQESGSGKHYSGSQVEKA